MADASAAIPCGDFKPAAGDAMADPSRGGSDHEGPTDTMSVGRFEATVSMPHSFNAPMQSRELGALRDSTESNHLSYSHAALRNFCCTGSVIRVAIRVGEQPAFGAYDRGGRCRPRSTDERGDGLHFRLRPRPHLPAPGLLATGAPAAKYVCGGGAAYGCRSAASRFPSRLGRLLPSQEA